MRQTHRKRFAVWSLTIGALALTPTVLKAQTVNLASSDSGEINGALYVWTDTQPTGTGYIDSFVRIQGAANGGVEQGYNTSGRPFAFDEKEPLNYTHNVQIKDLGSGVNINGTEYYQFLLDVNEPGGNKSNISLDGLKIFTSPAGSQTTANVNSLGTLRYDMGAGNWVLLDASRNGGSGSGDMYAFIPKSLFAGASPDDYMYLYSKLGANAEAQAGFEEWANIKYTSGSTTGGTTGGTTGSPGGSSTTGGTTGGGTTGGSTGGPSGGGTTGGTTGGPSGGGTTGGTTGGPLGGGSTGGGPSPVPEPSTYALLGAFMALAGWLKGRNDNSRPA